MDDKMTSWMLNSALAAMMAVAVFVPDPSEIRRAFEFQTGPNPTIKVLEDNGSALVTIAPEPAVSKEQAYRIESVSALECLKKTDRGVQEELDICLNRLMAEVAIFDRFATARLNGGSIVHPDPEIEDTRLAMTNLCRAQWSSNNGIDFPKSSLECLRVLKGVDY